MKTQKRIETVLAAVCMLFLCACGNYNAKTQENLQSDRTSEHLEVWAYQEELALPALESVTDTFNQGELRAEIRVLADREAFENALQDAQPDILLCDAGGEGVVPIAGDVLLLAVNTEVQKTVFLEWDNEELKSLEKICAYAQNYTGIDAPFLGIENYAYFMETALCLKGTSITGNRETDLQNDVYIYLHNLLGEVAFVNGLELEQMPLEQLLHAGPVCTIGNSSDFSKCSQTGIMFLPFPRPNEAADGVTAAYATGLKITSQNPDKTALAEKYVQYVRENIGGSGVLAEYGLIPFSGNYSTQGNTALEEALSEIYNNSELCVIQESGEIADKAGFDSACRTDFCRLGENKIN